jgi:hypothetical protein
MYRRGCTVVQKVAQLAPNYNASLPLLRSLAFADDLESMSSNQKQYTYQQRLPTAGNSDRYSSNQARVDDSEGEAPVSTILF